MNAKSFVRQFAVLGIITAVGNVYGGSPTELVVPGNANIFGAGHNLPPDPPSGVCNSALSRGIIPPVTNLVEGRGSVLTFSASGNVNWGGGSVGPEGTTTAVDHTDLPSVSGNGISGIKHLDRIMFLTGVFVGPDEPSDPAPPTLDFTGQDGFSDLFPLLNQVFFIGDGLVGRGMGSRQRFHIPFGATRLFLGFADGPFFQISPGCYHDNSGQLNVSVLYDAVTPTQTIVLDFDHSGPFTIVSVPVAEGVCGAFGVLFGETPRLDPTVGFFHDILNGAGKSFGDFKNDILNRTRHIYRGFGVEFVLDCDDASLSKRQRSHVYFTYPHPQACIAGVAVAGVDPCNLNKADSAIVYLNSQAMDPKYGDTATERYSILVAKASGVVSHEVGHLLGLYHAASFSNHWMWFGAPEFGVGRWMGQPFEFSDPLQSLSGLTQNDLFALATILGASPWVATGEAGTFDTYIVQNGCVRFDVIASANTATDIFEAMAIVSSGEDAGFAVPLGAITAGKLELPELALSIGQALQIEGSSTDGGESDVRVYFGSIDGQTTAAGLDPAGFAYSVPLSEQTGLRTITGSVLRIKDESFEVIGELEGIVPLRGDLNHNGYVERNDAGLLIPCLEGPEGSPSSECVSSDLNGDDFGDLFDYAYFANVFTGTESP